MSQRCTIITRARACVCVCVCGGGQRDLIFRVCMEWGGDSPLKSLKSLNIPVWKGFHVAVGTMHVALPFNGLQNGAQSF